VSVQLGIDGVGPGEVIGVGGSATVFAAQLDSGDKVAVKVLRSAVAGSQAERQFSRETTAIERVSTHEQVVSVLRTGLTDRSEPFLVMPLMRCSAQDVLSAQGPLQWANAVAIVSEIGDAVEFAHQKGVIHRDIKPANILLDQNGSPLLSDFGIAKLTDSQTMSSQIAATPNFAPPERFRGSAATAASDVYSLAATLCALVSGEAPFSTEDADGSEAVMRRVLADDPPDLTRFGLPIAVQSVIARSMSKDPAQRPQTVIDFLHQLRTAATATTKLSGHPTLGFSDETTQVIPKELPSPETTSDPTPASPASGATASRLLPLSIGSAIAVAVIAAVLWNFVGSPSSPPSADTEAVAAAQEATSTPTAAAPTQGTPESTAGPTIGSVEPTTSSGVSAASTTGDAAGVLASAILDDRFQIASTIWPTIEAGQYGLFSNAFGTSRQDFVFPDYVLAEAGPPTRSSCDQQAEAEDPLGRCSVEWEGWLEVWFAANTFDGWNVGSPFGTAPLPSNVIFEDTPLIPNDVVPPIPSDGFDGEIYTTPFKPNSVDFSQSYVGLGLTVTRPPLELRYVAGSRPSRIIGAATVRGTQVNIRPWISWNNNLEETARYAQQNRTILGTADTGDTFSVLETGIPGEQDGAGLTFAKILFRPAPSWTVESSWPITADPDHFILAYIAEDFLDIALNGATIAAEASSSRATTPGLEPKSPLSLTATMSDFVITLDGPVPSQEVLDLFAEHATDLVGETNVVNNVVVDPGAPMPANGNLRVNSAVVFSAGDTEIPREYGATMNQTVMFMQRRPDVTLIVEGHSDSDGAPEAKVRSSEDRANAIADWLALSGIPPERLKVIGYGDARPTASNDTEQGKAANRRVDLEYVNLLQG